MSGRLSSAEIAELAALLAELTAVASGKKDAGGGAPLESGLAAIAADLPSGRLRSVVERLCQRCAQGATLETALTDSADKLPPHLAALIGAGLRSGQLGPLLEEYVRTEEFAGDLSRHMWLAAAYPLILVVGSLMLVTLIFAGVVPTMAATFEDFGVSLPRITTLLIQISQGWWLGLAGVGLGLFLAWGFTRWGVRAPLRRRLTLRLPLVGPVWRWAAWARFSQLLALLVEQAIPLPEALRLVGAGVGDADIDDACRQAAEDLAAGLSTAESRVCRDRLPALMWQMLAWPPAQRDLPRTLRSLAEMFAGRARIQAALVAILGPWFAMSIVVATLWICVVALVLPLSMFVSMLV